MPGKVITFGEVMMRLSPPAQGRIKQTNTFNILYAGSEANVAASVSLFGGQAAHVTCFPDHDLGKAAVMELQKYGVDMRHTVFHEGRLGTYFIEHGASLRSPKIIYDRFDSAFANLDPSQFDWESILNGASWFHWSGITPAVSQAAADACLDAIQMARKLNVKVSGDINYRRNLWQYGKSAREVMPELISMTDIVIAGITDFDNCVGIADNSFQATCEKVIKHYPNIKKVATTERETISASHNRISGTLWNGKELLKSHVFDLVPIVDRVGSGDAFMGGLIWGFINSKSDADTLNFGTAACALKHTVEGDVNVVTAEEVNALIKGENVGKLLR